MKKLEMFYVLPVQKQNLSENIIREKDRMHMYIIIIKKLHKFIFVYFFHNIFLLAQLWIELVGALPTIQRPYQWAEKHKQIKKKLNFLFIYCFQKKSSNRLPSKLIWPQLGKTTSRTISLVLLITNLVWHNLSRIQCHET